LDTANDYRILVAEDAVERLERRVKSWNLPWPIRKKEVLTDIDALRKRILKIKYSFLPAEVLLTSEELKSLVEEAKRLLKRRTKEFAKRQFTWFRKERGFKWVNLSRVDKGELIKEIEAKLKGERA